MTVNVFPFPFVKPTYTDGVGNINANGSIQTFVAGTSTPIQTYADWTGTGLNPSTVVLDGAGQPSTSGIYGDDTLSYKAVAYDSTGAELWTVDEISSGGSVFPVGGVNGQVLTLVSGLPAWVTPTVLATNITGVVGIANGGTGGSTAAVGFNNLSPMTTKGDTIYEVTNGVAARLPIGTTGQVLTVVAGLPAWTTGGSTAANLSGGAAGSIPHQTAVNVTAMLPIGTAGQILTVSSVGEPAWDAPPSGTFIADGATSDLTRTGPSGNVADPDLTVALLGGLVYNYTVTARFYAPAAGVFIGVGYSGTFNSGAWTSYYGAGGGQGGGAVNGTFGVNSQVLYAAGIDTADMMVFQGTIITTGPGALYLYWGNPGAGGNTMLRYSGAGIVAVQCS